MKRISHHWLACMLALLSLTILAGCNPVTGGTDGKSSAKSAGSDQPASENAGEMSEPFKGEVVEKIDTGRYAYVQIDTGTKKVWVAVPVFNGKAGDVVEVPPGMPMADFHSKTLNRDFDMIYFVGQIRKEGEPSANPAETALPEGHPPIGEPADGQMTPSPMMGGAAPDAGIEAGVHSKGTRRADGV